MSWYDWLPSNCVFKWEFNVDSNNDRYLDIYVNFSIFFPILNTFLISGHIYMKVTNIKFHGNMCSGSCTDITSRRLADWRTDMTKLIVALRSYTNSPKTGFVFNLYISLAVFLAFSKFFSASWLPNFGGI